MSISSLKVVCIWSFSSSWWTNILSRTNFLSSILNFTRNFSFIQFWWVQLIIKKNTFIIQRRVSAPCFEFKNFIWYSRHISEAKKLVVLSFSFADCTTGHWCHLSLQRRSCTQQMVLDEGQSCGTVLAAQFNKVALKLKNLMHLKQHFPHTDGHQERTVTKTERQHKNASRQI